MTTEAQQLLDAAFAGKLDLDADASQATPPTTAESGTAANPEETKTETTQEQGAANQDDEKPAPIASKSGEYTIPYDKLVEARQQRDMATAEAKQAKQEAEQLRQQLAQLTAAQSQNLAAAQEQAQARADAGQAPTQADKNLALAEAATAAGVDTSLFGDFSEEAIAKGVAMLVEQRANALVDAKLEKALAPLREFEARTKQATADSAEAAHRNEIYGAHPDADEVYESAEFKSWKASQPAFVRAGIEHALTKGSAQDVIGVFSTFKEATGKAKPSADAAVRKALESAQAQPPASLSDLPGAAPGVSEAERIAAMANNPAALLDYMTSLPVEKQNRLMNAVV